MKDTILYDKLEISPSISDEDLKKEGRKLLLKWHPDKNENKEESSKKFIEIKEILDILTDTEKREIYHQIGIDILDTNYQNTQNTQNIHQNSVNNMFNTDIFKGFNNFFGNFTRMVNNINENNTNINNNNTPNSYDRDVIYYVNINANSITNINTFYITYKRYRCQVCDLCQGKGFIKQEIDIPSSNEGIPMVYPSGVINDINTFIYSMCKTEDYKEEEKKIIITVTIEKVLDIMEKNQTIILKEQGNILKDKITDLVVIFNE